MTAPHLAIDPGWPALPRVDRTLYAQPGMPVQVSVGVRGAGRNLHVAVRSGRFVGRAVTIVVEGSRRATAPLIGGAARVAIAFVPDELVHVTVEGAATEPGADELAVSIAPDGDAGAAVVHRQALVVSVPVRVLRALPDPWAEDPARRQLERRTTLFGMIALGADPATCAAVAERAFRAWAARIHVDGAPCLVQRSAVGPDVARKYARLGFERVDGPWFAERRARALAHLWTADAVTFVLTTGDVPPPLPTGFWEGYHGLSLERRPSALDRGEPPVTHLGLWLDVALAGEAAAAAATDELRALLDACMADGGGLQAALGRWGWGPKVVEPTPYERASGVYVGFRARAWLRRWLRGVTPELWLGDDLAAALGPIDDVLATRRLAHGVHLASSRPLAELEAVLAAIVPGAADEAAFMRDVA